MPNTIALITAGGKGLRFGADIAKQYLKLNGKMIITHTIETFLSHPDITNVKVIIAKGDEILYKNAIENVKNNPKLLPPVFGGKTRQETVRLGLESLKENNPDFVLMQDAVRPLTKTEQITDTIKALQNYNGAIVGHAVTDTLKEIDKEKFTYKKTVDRSKLYAVQTPQGFNYHDILNSHIKHKDENVTDDGALAELDNMDVKIIPGPKSNIKITTKDDLKYAEFLLKEQNKQEG